MTLRLRKRILLILELLFGLLPISIIYIYYFRVILFWIRQVLELATGGIMNAYTSFVAAIFVMGGIGLASLWVVLIGRLFGRTSPGRIARTGLVIAIVAGIAVLAFLPFYSSFWWIDFYLCGAPLLVAAHQAFALVRSKSCRLRHVAP
jgi:hypothetical protein